MRPPTEEEQEKYAKKFNDLTEQRRRKRAAEKKTAKPTRFAGYAFVRSAQGTIDAAQEALESNGGKLVIPLDNSGAEPSLIESKKIGRLLKKWLPPHDIHGLTPEFIERNADFSKYKKLLESQGIQIESIEVTPAADGAGIKNPHKATTVGFATLSAAGLIGIPLGIHWQLHAAAGTVALAIPAATAVNQRFKIFGEPSDTSHKIELQLEK
jgi:hypothetical protein